MYAFEERFWKKVNKTENCWEWIASRNEFGYGKFGIHNKMYKAHRVSYVISCGPICSGDYVLHKCDNPGCVRPDHLFIGSQATNMGDMNSKGRGKGYFIKNPPRGVKNHNAVLDEDSVKEIRRLYSPRSYSRPRLAKEFGVDRTTIDCILSRKTWSHI